MPRYSDITNANVGINAKYSLTRNINTSQTAQTDGDIFTQRTHISTSLEDSRVWFNRQKQLLKSKRMLFEDPLFPAEDTSVFFSREMNKRFEWKRPKEIDPSAEFIVGDASRFDIQQGELGDCWLLAAVASLSMYPDLIQRVVPEGQLLNGPDYVGAFWFRFWQFGHWVDIVVDDRLPTSRGKLVFLHSPDRNEFWSALLEKAYAKLATSYEALKGGSSSEAMEDFTGGIIETFDLGQSTPTNLWDILTRASDRHSLMGCSIEAEGAAVESKAEKGLLKGHAYSVTDIKPINTRRGVVKLIRVRNPWGNECEWEGAWSDRSPEWNEISESERKRLGLTFSDDGEFWMSFSDFTKYFTKLDVCHLGPDTQIASDTGELQTTWELCVENGEWQRNVSAGGCRNFLQTFHLNPQFRVVVVDSDDGDKEGTLIIGLMQKEMRLRKKEGQDLFTIGYAIYALKDAKYENTLLDTMFFRTTTSVAKSPSFINLREICGRHKLVPGKYAIVPSTFNPNEEAKFLLRIFSEKPHKSNQIDTKTELVEPNWQGLGSPDQKREEVAGNERLREAFKVIAGIDNEIDADELRMVLNTAFKREEFNFDGFTLETCRSMVAMMDSDQSGKLGFEEFKVLWNDLRLWKTIFKEFDKDHSGTFNTYEIREALTHIGFKLSNRIFSAMSTRYAKKDGTISFDDYILLLVRLKTIYHTYKAQRKTEQNEAIFPQDEFIQCVLYL